MKNLIKVALILISLTFFSSCTSKSAEKAKVKKKMQKNELAEKKVLSQKLDEKTLTPIDSIFEKTSSDIKFFVSEYNNWADSYYWKSDKMSDKPYDMIRLCGMETLSDVFIIEKRSSKKNSTDVMGYSVERNIEGGETVYSLETSFFRNNKEMKSRREYFVISTAEELVAALKPFYRRLKEAKQDIKKNISRIEKMADKS